MTTRVLLHVQHLLGVGHVRRAAALARAMQRAGLEVTMALGGEPDALADFGGARTHQLPSARAADMRFSAILDETGRPVDADWWTRRTAALLDVHAATVPDVVLTEHFPFGRRQFARELVPLFERHRQTMRGPILCSVRDVLVDKPKLAGVARTIELTRRWFDAVLVHGDPDVLPLTATFPAAREVSDLLHYTGYVVDSRPDDGTAVPDAGDGHGEIIVSVGGGAVGEELLATALAAAASDRASGRRWRLLAGGNLPEEVFRRLQTSARPVPSVALERARPDFRRLLARAAASVSQAGYNTLMDVLVTGCPAVVVPFIGDGSESEQLFRAREIERRGHLTVLAESDLSPPALLAAVERTLARRRPAGEPGAARIRLDGAERSAALVKRFAAAQRGPES